MDFPHLKDTKFPDLANSDVYAIKNTFDYSRWSDAATLKVCAVRWDRQYRNAVKFDSDEERDAYFEALEGETIELNTAFQMMPDGSAKLPLPFDQLLKKNYLVVKLQAMTSAGKLIDYEQTDGIRTLFYFIDSIKALAPNATQVNLSLDYWTTFINRIEISYMQLERGHAALTGATVDEYLANPLEKNALLLAPDVTTAPASIVSKSNPAIINSGDMMLCFASTANLLGAWGTKSANTWEVAEFNSAITDTAPTNVALFAIAASNYVAFCDYIENNIPQFVPTVQGIFLLPRRLLTLANGTQIGGITVYRAAGKSAAIANIQLQKDDFGYPDEYKELAKLYTYPYASLEITDENGSNTEIRIEETSGNIGFSALVNLAFPYISIETLVSGVGGVGASVTFENIGSRNFEFQGTWAEHIQRHGVPVYAMTQGMSKNYDFATHFSRRQTSDELNLQYSNTVATQDQTMNNTNTAIAASVDNLATAQDAEYAIYGHNADKIRDDHQRDLTFQNAYLASSIQAEQQQAQINKSQTVANALTTATVGIAAAVTAPITGGGSIAAAAAIGGGLAAVTSITSAAVSVAATDANVAITLTKDSTVAQASVNQQYYKTENAITLARQNLVSQQGAARTQLTRSNTATRTQVSGMVSVAKSNALAARNLMQTGITRQISQAELSAPLRFGATSDASTATIKPQGYFLNIKTQTKAGIKAAGDAFLRFGYYLNQAWTPESLQVMKHFTYWKAPEVWILATPEVEQDAIEAIRTIFADGVTVWSKPEEIGAISIYENEVVR